MRTRPLIAALAVLALLGAAAPIVSTQAAEIGEGVAIQPANGPNGAYAQVGDDGQVSIQLDGDAAVPGASLPADALAHFDRVFVVVNTNTAGDAEGRQAYVHVRDEGGAAEDFDFYRGTEPGGRTPIEGTDNDIHLISGINRNGITVRDLDITSNASFDTNAIDIRGVDLEIVDNTVTDAGIQVQHDSKSSGGSDGGSVTISGNSVTESGSGSGGIKDEGIVAFTNDIGLGNFSYTIEDNRVRDASTPAIKLTDLKSTESPQDVNGESDKQDQIEALLRDNDVFSARIEGSNGAQVQTTSGSTFNTIQSAVDDAAAGSQGDSVALADSGTFTESITVDDDVSLRGPNAGTPGQDSARGEEAIIDGGGPAVTLDADKAEIDGFRVEGDGSSGDVIDIPESGTSNTVRVKNNIVRTSASGSGFINGIEVVNSDPDGGVGKPASAIIEGNDIKIDTGRKRAAINVLSGPNHNTITVRNNRLRGDIGGYRDINTLTVEDNEILPASAAAPNSAMDVSGVDDATFTDNTFRGDVGDLAYDDDSESTGKSNTGAATATSVLNNNDGNSGNTFEPGAKVVNDGGRNDNDDVIEFSND